MLDLSSGRRSMLCCRMQCVPAAKYFNHLGHSPEGEDSAAADVKTYVVVQKTTVRSGIKLKSKDLGELEIGHEVTGVKEQECDGHLRLQISAQPEQWVSIATSKKNVLLKDVSSLTEQDRKSIEAVREKGGDKKGFFKKAADFRGEYLDLPDCTEMVSVRIHYSDEDAKGQQNEIVGLHPLSEPNVGGADGVAVKYANPLQADEDDDSGSS